MTQLPLTTLLIQITMTACVIAYTSIYLIGIGQSKVKPILATWMFLTLATILSWITNFGQTGFAGITANSFNFIDSISCLIIFFVILCRKNIRKTFTSFEKACLGAVILVFIGWLLSGQNVLAHVSIQVILVIAYLPTLVHLWNAKKNTESLPTWSLNCLGAALGMIEPLRAMDLLPMLYTGRAILCTAAVSLLIVRLKLKKK